MELFLFSILFLKIRFITLITNNSIILLDEKEISPYITMLENKQIYFIEMTKNFSI
jgi:hypothetical protein